MQGDVSTLVKSVLTRIKDAQAAGQPLVSIDLSGGPPMVVSRVIQSMLVERGFVVMLALAPDGATERLYVDMTRKRG